MPRPRPVPPKRRLIEPSTWLKRLNRRSCCAGAMPMPVSVTAKRTMSPGSPSGAMPSPSRLHGQGDGALGGELHGVVEQVQQHLPQAARHRRPRSRERRIDPGLDPQAAPEGAAADDRDRVVHDRDQRERDRIEGQLAGLDLREVEDVVDDGEQGRARSSGSVPAGADPRSGSRSRRGAGRRSPGCRSSGVRISWLIAARNSLLASLARSASARAASASTVAARRAASADLRSVMSRWRPTMLLRLALGAEERAAAGVDPAAAHPELGGVGRGGLDRAPDLVPDVRRHRRDARVPSTRRR